MASFTATPETDAINAHRETLHQILGDPRPMLVSKADALAWCGISLRTLHRLTAAFDGLAIKLDGEREHQINAQGMGWVCAQGDPHAAIHWPEPDAAAVLTPVAGTIVSVLESCWHETAAHRFARWLREGVLSACDENREAPDELYLMPGELLGAAQLCNSLVQILARDTATEMPERAKAAALLCLIQQRLHQALCVAVSNGYSCSADPQLRERGADQTD